MYFLFSLAQRVARAESTPSEGDNSSVVQSARIAVAAGESSIRQPLVDRRGERTTSSNADTRRREFGQSTGLAGLETSNNQKNPTFIGEFFPHKKKNRVGYTILCASNY